MDICFVLNGNETALTQIRSSGRWCYARYCDCRRTCAEYTLINMQTRHWDVALKLYVIRLWNLSNLVFLHKHSTAVWIIFTKRKIFINTPLFYTFNARYVIFEINMDLFSKYEHFYRLQFSFSWNGIRGVPRKKTVIS